MNAWIVKLGNKLVGIITLVISLTVVAIVLFWQYQQSSSNYKQYQTVSQKQIAEMIYQSVSTRVQAINKQVAYIANLPELATLVLSKDTVLIEDKQREIANMFASVHKVCLLDVEIDNVSSDGCIGISFATLNSLREAKTNGGAAVVMMQVESEGAHLLFAQQIVDVQSKIVGVLVVALKPDTVRNILGDSFGASGYVELQQGKSGTALLASKGNIKWKKGQAIFSEKLPESYWQISYWSQPQGLIGFQWMLCGIALGIILIMGFLREGWQTYLLKRDTKILNQQLKDAEIGELKMAYPLVFTSMNDLANNIQALGLMYFQAITKKGATAESLLEKMDNAEQSNDLVRLDSNIDDEPDSL